jgi:DNA-binding transcriptional MerR regulator
VEITKSILESFAIKLLDNELKVEDIPSIKQYADQVTELLNSKLHHRRKGDETSVAISKAMINNYTKNGLLNPSDKKKYDKNHIILLSLIYHLKQVMSLDDIKTIFNPILKSLDGSEAERSIIALDDIYKAFLELILRCL